MLVRFIASTKNDFKNSENKFCFIDATKCGLKIQNLVDKSGNLISSYPVN